MKQMMRIQIQHTSEEMEFSENSKDKACAEKIEDKLGKML